MIFKFGLLASIWLTYALVSITNAQLNDSISLPVRREINYLAQQGGPPLDIFILALTQLQAKEEDDPLGYFQIAGIHGYPATAYDGVPLNSPDDPGYCRHSSLSFPTWHRIYMNLFETSLLKAAHEISNMYPAEERDEYQHAADMLRLPYWDWLSHAELPDLATREKIGVHTPKGWMEIVNPLFTYKFHAGSGLKYGFPEDMKESLLPETVRKPDANGRSNHTAANLALRSCESLLLSVAYRCLTYTSIYDDFARMPQPIDSFDSNIEVLHNAVHNAAGGKGSHLSTTEFAAFDPLFWLHHANLDRLFAFWQVLNPRLRVEEKGGNNNQVDLSQAFRANLDSELAPFRKGDGSMWTARQAWDWELLGYTYPELADRKEPDDNEQAEIKLRILLRELYWSKAFKKQKK